MDELEIIRYSQLEGLTVFVNAMAYRTPHFHPEWELLWVLDHPLLAVYRGQEHRIEPGDIVLFPPNFAHELRKLEGECTFLCLQISSTSFTPNRHITLDDIHLKHYLSSSDCHEIRRSILDIARHYFLREDLYDLYCWGQCAVLMYRLLKALPHHEISSKDAAQMERQNARLMRLTQYVEENYMHKIRLADFAAQEGCSVSYLSHFIHERMNQTFQDYVTFVRFNHACKRIAEGGDSMLSISVESGFSDYRYFSRTFQKVYGMTPAEYRNCAQPIIADDGAAERSACSQELRLNNSQSLYMLRRFQDQLEEGAPGQTDEPAVLAL